MKTWIELIKGYWLIGMKCLSWVMEMWGLELEFDEAGIEAGQSDESDFSS